MIPKTLPQLLKEARRACHAYIKARDRDGQYARCISCSQTFPAKEMDAGHYFKSELYPSLRFNEDNIHLQCTGCNRHMEGNLLGYRPRLIEKIGPHAYNTLQDTVRLHRKIGFKWDRHALMETIRYYRAKLKELDSQSPWP